MFGSGRDQPGENVFGHLMATAIAISVLLALLAIDLIVRVNYARIVLSTFDTKPPFNVARVPPDPQAERISFPSTNGLTLHGSVHRPAHRTARGVILFCPELDGSHWLVTTYCEGLIQAGFVLVAFDFRNQGESEHLPDYEPNHWLTRYEIDDAVSALEWIEAHPELSQLPLGVMGVSRGSTAALYVAAHYPHVLAVCCDGAYSIALLTFHFVSRWASIYMPRWLEPFVPEWHFRSTGAIVRRLSAWRRQCEYVLIESSLTRLRRCPTLLIAGQRDNYVPVEIGHELVRLMRSPLAKLLVVPKAKHNRARQVDPGFYDEAIVEHFEQMLPEQAAGSRSSSLTTSSASQRLIPVESTDAA
jgi:pimeloyl-ACP methyl ester carboxylesterase